MQVEGQVDGRIEWNRLRGKAHVTANLFDPRKSRKRSLELELRIHKTPVEKQKSFVFVNI